MPACRWTMQPPDSSREDQQVEPMWQKDVRAHWKEFALRARVRTFWRKECEGVAIACWFLDRGEMVTHRMEWRLLKEVVQSRYTVLIL